MGIYFCVILSDHPVYMYVVAGNQKYPHKKDPYNKIPHKKIAHAKNDHTENCLYRELPTPKNPHTEKSPQQKIPIVKITTFITVYSDFFSIPKDAQCSETNAEPNFRFLRFLAIEIWSILY